MSLIIPSAGLSSKSYPKPKWILTCPNGNLMIQECINGLDLTLIDNIYVTVLEEHCKKYLENIEISDLFRKTGKNIHVLKLLSQTSSQSETVYQTIKYFNIDGPIFIKDCDNNFNGKIDIGNYVFYIKDNEFNELNNLHEKSFIEINENNNKIINICEKKIISNTICTGGYSFSEASIFTKSYEECVKLNLDNLYISHIILNSILNKEDFYAYEVKNFVDWGTNGLWVKYLNSFKTLFVDIDGTLFHNCGKYSKIKWGENIPLINNSSYIKELYNNGKTQIILTTSRSEEFKEKTIEQLKKYDIKYHHIIFGLFHCKRYLINDYADSNPYPTAIAINVERDRDNLQKLL